MIRVAVLYCNAFFLKEQLAFSEPLAECQVSNFHSQAPFLNVFSYFSTTCFKPMIVIKLSNINIILSATEQLI